MYIRSGASGFLPAFIVPAHEQLTCGSTADHHCVKQAQALLAWPAWDVGQIPITEQSIPDLRRVIGFPQKVGVLVHAGDAKSGSLHPVSGLQHFLSGRSLRSSCLQLLRACQCAALWAA